MTHGPSDISPPEIASPPAHRRVFRFWKCFWLSFLAISLVYAWYCFYVPSNEVAWADDFASAQQRAVKTGKPTILYFSGAWCVPCRIMKRQVWADEQVTARVNADFVPVAIDVDVPANAEILARYRVKGAPVTIVTDPHGNVLDWRAGGIGKSEFLELLDSARQSDAKAWQT